MKKFTAILAFTFFLIKPFLSSAQCIADAGNDTLICPASFPFTPFEIGGNPTATGGSGNYTYRWSTFYDGTINDYFASDFLNDTTLSNPTVETSWDSTLVFHVQVQDDSGNSCKDSATIIFSSWVCVLGECIYLIEPEDTVQLWPACGSSFLLLSYEWSPQDNLSDPFVANPLAFPSATTTYSVTIEDSLGCQMVTHCDVIVNPSSISENVTNGLSVTVIPNPIDKSSVVQFDNPDYKKTQIEIFNSIGIRMVQTTTRGNSFEIGSLLHEAGEYFYRISSEGKTMYTGRFTNN